jgi:hypothetical protein
MRLFSRLYSLAATVTPFTRYSCTLMVLVGLCCAWLFGLYLPLRRTIQQLQKQSQQDILRRVQKSQLDAQLRRSALKVSESQAELKTYRQTAMLKNPALTLFGICNAQGVVACKFDVQTYSSHDWYEQQNFTLSGKISWNMLAPMIEALSNAIPTLYIEQFSYTIVTSEKMYDFNLSGAIFSYRA